MESLHAPWRIEYILARKPELKEGLFTRIAQSSDDEDNLIIGVVAGALLFLDDPTWRTAALLGLVIWSFCRFYYFAFYVIEKYVDPAYRFSGLISFVRYWLQRRR